MAKSYPVHPHQLKLGQLLSNAAVIRVYDKSGMIQAHEHTGDFKEW